SAVTRSILPVAGRDVAIPAPVVPVAVAITVAGALTLRLGGWLGRQALRLVVRRVIVTLDGRLVRRAAFAVAGVADFVRVPALADAPEVLPHLAPATQLGLEREDLFGSVAAVLVAVLTILACRHGILGGQRVLDLAQAVTAAEPRHDLVVLVI